MSLIDPASTNGVLDWNRRQPQALPVNPLDYVLDTDLRLAKQVAGAVLDDTAAVLRFSTLIEAERIATQTAARMEGHALQLTRVIDAIREQQLWQGEADPDTGEHYRSFDSYLKSFLLRVGKHIGVTGKSTIYTKMACIALYERQLEYPDGFLAEMGEHLTHLLRAANMTPRGWELLDYDTPTPMGGAKLGREGFRAVVEDVAQRVRQAEANPDAPGWRVLDTAELVNGVTGASSQEKARFEWQVQAAAVAGTYRINALVVYVGDYRYAVGSDIPLAHLKILTKGHDVVGLGEETP